MRWVLAKCTKTEGRFWGYSQKCDFSKENCLQNNFTMLYFTQKQLRGSLFGHRFDTGLGLFLRGLTRKNGVLRDIQNGVLKDAEDRCRKTLKPIL